VQLTPRSRHSSRRSRQQRSRQPDPQQDCCPDFLRIHLYAYLPCRDWSPGRGAARLAVGAEASVQATGPRQLQAPGAQRHQRQWVVAVASQTRPPSHWALSVVETPCQAGHSSRPLERPWQQEGLRTSVASALQQRHLARPEAHQHPGEVVQQRRYHPEVETWGEDPAAAGRQGQHCRLWKVAEEWWEPETTVGLVWASSVALLAAAPAVADCWYRHHYRLTLAERRPPPSCWRRA
jgi:hypothetical protein